jgi:NitT/TauT family transport system substrate-binding protein
MSTPRPAFLSLVLALAACSTTPSATPSSADPNESRSPGVSPPPSPVPVRQVTLLLGFQPDVQFAPFYLAQQNGLFTEAGLDVTIEHSDDVIRLVADGQANVGVADATDVMIGRTAGIPIKYVSTLYGHFPVALIGAPPTVPAEPSGLAGLRIGTPGRFGSSWHALLALLDAGGLTEDDVTIREYPQFNQVEGLLNGDVDIITGFRTNEPLRLEAQGFDVELMTVDDFAPLPGPGVVAGDELLAADLPLVTDFANAVLAAQEAIAADPQVGLDAAIAEIPAIAEDRETAQSVLEATIEAWDGPIAAVQRQVWATGYDTMQGLGFIDGSLPVDDMYDRRPMGGSD